MTTVAMSALPKLLERHSAKTVEACAKGMRSAARYARGYLVRVTPKDRGLAQHGWKVYEGRLGGPALMAQVFNDCPYIGILEKGARPHPVSAEGRFAIYEWVVRNFRLVGSAREGYAAVHGNDLHEGQRRRTMRGMKGMGGARLTSPGRFTQELILKIRPQEEGKLNPIALNITGAICRKINLQGQKPRYFVRDSLPHLQDVSQREVERCLREVAPKDKP